MSAGRGRKPVFAYEARRKAGFGSLRSAIREPASACTVQDLTLVALRACGGCSRVASTVTTIETVLSASRARDLQRQLPALSSGEGVLETEFAGYAPVAGLPPTRRWTTANPLNREEYLMHLARRVAASS